MLAKLFSSQPRFSVWVFFLIQIFIVVALSVFGYSVCRNASDLVCLLAMFALLLFLDSNTGKRSSITNPIVFHSWPKLCVLCKEQLTNYIDRSVSHTLSSLYLKLMLGASKLLSFVKLTGSWIIL